MPSRLARLGALWCLGSLLTLGAGLWRSDNLEQTLLTKYRQHAEERLDRALARMQGIRSVLDTLQVFLDTVPNPAPRDFAHLTLPLRRHSGIDALFVAMPTEASQRQSFERSWQASYPGYSIRYRNFMGLLVPSPDQASYLPTVYATFSQPSRISLGVDLLADNRLGLNMLHADNDGYMLSPSFRNEGGPATTVLMRWRGARAGRQLLGLSFVPSGLLEGMPGQPVIHDYWFDVTDRDKPTLIHPESYGNQQMRLLANRSLTLGGRTWRLETRLDGAMIEEAQAASWYAVLALGGSVMLLCSLLFGLPRRMLASPQAASEVDALRAELDRVQASAAAALRDGVRLRSILDTAGEAVVLIDRFGKIEQFNAAAEKMFGYSAAEVLGANVGVLMPPGTRERHDGALANYLSTGQSRVMGTGRELVAQKKGGDAFPVELSLNEFDIDNARYYVGVIRDVTARKRAERMLFESEYKHRAILDAAHVGIFLLQDGCLRYVNPAFADNFGRKPGDFTDQTALSFLVAPAWIEALSVALDPERSGGRPTEVLMQREDGSRFYALVTAKPIIYDNKPGLAGSLLDISERKAAEEAMLRAEIRNIAILEAIPDLMLQLDAEGIILDCRVRSGSTDFAIDTASIGQHYRRGVPAPFADRLDEALGEGWSARLRSFEYQLNEGPDAQDFEARVTPASDGEWLVMVREISERKRIEAELIRHRDHLADLVRERTAELDALFNASPLATAFVKQRHFIDVNTAFVRLFGHAREDLLNQSTRLIFVNDHAHEVIGEQVYSPLIDGGQLRTECSFVTADGRELLCEVLGQAIDPRDPVAGRVWVYRDISERRAAETALLTAKELAEAASRAKSEFLANMSHELRTPMHAVLSFAELGERKAETEPAKVAHYFGRIRSSGQRLLQILNDLLDLSKLEAGKMRYDFRPLQLASTVREVADEFAPLARQQQLRLHVDIGTPAPDVCADALRIGQVVRNLVSNAIKFSPPDGEVWVRIHISGDDWVELVVEDQGVGIPESELSAIFDKFTQSSKTKTGAGGTGLGLAISREIVEAHRGRILAENRPEGGARFFVALPAA
ncbi:PAS domain S-box protein [Chitinimonas sp.]|uniref:PAS domain S-box protein n=1 Tax=Chitinimonas sp. TaxID=1934313 RepID=UPI0035AF4F6F